jgi:hypothetical protein
MNYQEIHRKLMTRQRGNKYHNSLKQRITNELEKINFKSYEITPYLIKIRSRDVKAIEWGMLEIRPLTIRAYVPSKKYIDSLSGQLYYNRLLKAYEDLMKVIDKEPFNFIYTFEETEKDTGFAEAMKYFNAVTGRA